MARLVIVVMVLACTAGFATASVIDGSKMMRQRIMGRDGIAAGDMIGNDRISRMSRLDLMRQKFLLDVMLRVQQPLVIPELLKLSQTLIVDASMYIDGIDDEMQHIIDLSRSVRLLRPDEVFTIAEEEHVRQMIGLYRLFVRSRDWDTFERNVCYARRYVNGELLINALVLAVRDRSDTQALIVPALHELLPQLYYDRDLVRRVQTLDMQTARSAVAGEPAPKTARPDLIELIGMSRRRKLEASIGGGVGMLDRTQIWMPWREMRMQMAARQPADDRRLVLPLERDDDLLADDIGLRAYVHGMINEMCLREGEIEVRRDDIMQRRDPIRDTMPRGAIRDDDSIERQEEDYSRRPMVMDRYIPRTMMEEDDDRDDERLATRQVDDERLLHIGRRRQPIMSGDGLNARERLLHLVSDGRRVMSGMRSRMEGIDRQEWGMRRRLIEDEQEEREEMLGRRLDKELPTVSSDDERLLHVGRRHRILPYDSIRGDSMELDTTRRQAAPIERRMMHVSRGAAIHDGRRTYEERDRRRERGDPMRLDMARGMEDIGDMPIDADERRQRLRADDDEYASRLQRMRGMQGRRGMDMDMDMRRDRDMGIPMERRLLRDKVEQYHRTRNEMDRGDDDEEEGRVRVDDDDDEDDDDLTMRGQREMVTIGRRRRLPRSLDSIMGSEGRRSGGELMLHNLRQLVARLDLDRVGGGVGIGIGIDDVPIRRINDPRMLSEERAGERYALRLNEMRLDTRRQRQILERIAVVQHSMLLAIEQEVHRVLGADEMRLRDAADIDRIIGEVLLGSRIEGVGMVRMLRDVLLQQRNADDDSDMGGIDLRRPCIRLLVRRIMSGIDALRDRLLGAYRRDDLLLDGVVINDIAVDRLRTYIDSTTDADLVNLVDARQQDEQMLVARQSRLNHKQFTISVDLSSDRAQRVVMRTWLGPATQGVVDMDQLRHQFVLLDTAAVELRAGSNMLQRKSRDLMWTARDTTPFTEIYRRVMAALEGDRTGPLMALDIVGEMGRFPHRLLVPRGLAEGRPMQLLVVITRADSDRIASRRSGLVAMGIDDDRSMDRSLPLGFPLDRSIGDELSVPNMRIKDVLVYHEDKVRLDAL